MALYANYNSKNIWEEREEKSKLNTCLSYWGTCEVRTNSNVSVSKTPPPPLKHPASFSTVLRGGGRLLFDFIILLSAYFSY